jgi:hypothetical protein
VRFVDGRYEPVEIERADLMMLLEGIDSDSVKRLKRYRRAEPWLSDLVLDKKRR